jgi:hypothetical protein
VLAEEHLNAAECLCPETRIRVNVLGLEIVVNLGLGSLGETTLNSIVLVTKVVAVARRDVGESKGVVGRVGAAVRRPIQRGWIFIITSSLELRESNAEKELIGDGVAVLAPQAGVDGSRSGQGRRGQGNNYSIQLHICRCEDVAEDGNAI